MLFFRCNGVVNQRQVKVKQNKLDVEQRLAINGFQRRDVKIEPTESNSGIYSIIGGCFLLIIIIIKIRF